MPGCALRYCRNTSKNTDKSSGVTFHRFPRVVNRSRDQWTHFVRLDRSEPQWSPSDHSYLCSDHFSENDFIHTQNGRKFTKLSAVPSVPSQFGGVQPESSAKGSVTPMDTSEGGSSSNGNWDGRNVAMAANGGAFGGQRLEPRFGVILEATRIVREPTTVCCVFGCRNSVRDNPDKEFYEFPARTERSNVWLKLINRLDLTGKLKASTQDHRVCSDHFDKEDYVDDSLKYDAVPKYLLPVRKVNIVYDCDAGPSSLPVKEIKKEVVETMEIEIQFEPEVTKVQPKPPVPPPIEPHAKIVPKQEPVSPTATEDPLVHIFDSYNLVATEGNVKAREVETDLTDPNIEAKEIKKEYASKKERFWKRATISPVEIVHLPGVFSEIVLKKVKTSTAHVQTTKLLADQLNAPLRKQYEAEMREIKKYIRVWETKMDRYARSPMGKKEFQQNCDTYLDEKFSSLVKFHCNIANKASGNRYTSEFKTLVLNLYFSSPRAYNFVEKLFHLPSRATTIRSQVPIRTGINLLFIEYFKAKVDKMSAKEKTCAVCFDYIELSKNLHYCVNNDFLYGLHDIDQVTGTEPAEYATLIMVRGLYSNWKQPISFAFVAEKRCYPELKEWLYKILAMLIEIGLNVKALVTKPEAEFLEFPEVSVGEPHFEVDGRKIYQVLDVPVLFKSVRDALMTNDFHFGTKVVKWSYISKVYNTDKAQELRLIPKLTEKHMRPDKEGDSAKLAIQVFSRTVAAAMNFHVNAKLINAKAKDTVEFIQIMNTLFDVLNSNKINHPNEFKRAYSGTEAQKQFLMNAFEYLQQLEIKDKHGNEADDSTNFVPRLLITIKSILSLSEDLKQESCNYLTTKQLSVDCQKKYFDKVRELGGNCCSKPTAIMFARSFRRLFLVYLVSNNRGGSEMDLKSTLTKISDYVKVDDDLKKEESEQMTHNRFLKVSGGDCLKLWPKPGPIFIGGYLLSKCLEKHPCNKLISTLCAQYNVEEDNAELLIARFKEYNPSNLTNPDLVPPPECMVDIALKMDGIFDDYLSREDKDMYNFGWNIYLTMEGEVFEMPCPCFPVIYLKLLFIRMKIFHTIRHYNRSVKPRRSRTAKASTS